MDVSDLRELLSDIYQKLHAIHTKIDTLRQGHATMSQLAEIRQLRLEEVRCSYERQNAVIEPYPDGEDGYDEVDKSNMLNKSHAPS